MLGGLITLLFTAENVYLGLKVGITFATSIPAAVISMALLRFVSNSNILENNIVQTIASAAGTLAAIIFVAWRLGWMATALYVPCLAIHATSGGEIDLTLMIVIAALFGRSTWNIIVIIGIIYWTFTARLLRAQTKSVRERVYVQRARALGARNSRLVLRHVLPQVTPLLIANTVLLIAYAIFAETFITFLGLGDPTAISWGRLIENAFTDDAIINDAWWAIIPPGLCVMFVVLACTILGQAMEDALNPRLRTGHVSVRRFRVLPSARREEP